MTSSQCDPAKTIGWIRVLRQWSARSRVQSERRRTLGFGLGSNFQFGPVWLWWRSIEWGVWICLHYSRWWRWLYAEWVAWSECIVCSQTARWTRSNRGRHWLEHHCEQYVQSTNALSLWANRNERPGILKRTRHFGELVGQTMSAVEVPTKPTFLQSPHCHNELDVVKCAITFAFHCNLNVCQRCKFLSHHKFKLYLSFTGASSSEVSLAKKIHSVIFIICTWKKKKHI